MGFLSKKTTKTPTLNNTTKGFYLGSPEAEGENRSEKQNLLAFFEDYINIQEQIQNGKFIISGRKGSGKSAFVKYLLDNSSEKEEMFCSLIKPNEFDLENLIQTIPSTINDKYEIIFEWIILTRFVQLILKSNQLTYTKEIRSLKDFFKKNSGIIEIDKFLIVEENDNKQSTVNINSLRGPFSSIISKSFGSKKVHAPFYNLIPSLREVVVKILNLNGISNFDFILLFDDLDIKFKLSEIQNRIKLLDLIRITKRYNTEYLKGTKGKVLIFLRDDIGKRLDGIDSDKNKMFGSYEYKINWYSHEFGQIHENNILLKQFINKRIKINFETLGIDYDKKDPWSTLVDNLPKIEYNNKTAFKYILNYTFYRPRDIVNIFKDIGNHAYPFPLNPESIQSLLKGFLLTNVGEIKDELALLFDNQEIESIFRLFFEMSKTNKISYNELMELMEDEDLDEQCFFALVDYSLLIPMDSNGKCYYNYREQPLFNGLETYEYTLPKSIYIYFKPNYM